MSARTVLTLANARGLDLRNPTAADYADPCWVAEHLAKEKRYNGATPGVEYSVAQHACHCADAALEMFGDRTIAAYALIHDNHEAALKDDTTPKKRAIAEEAEARFGVLASNVLAAFNAVTERHDRAIHDAAGLPFPLPPTVAAAVKRVDLLLFVTEWRDVMGGIPHPNWEPYAAIKPWSTVITPWDWCRAERQFLARCYALLPALQGRGAA